MEPLENVLDLYGGNSEKMRLIDDDLLSESEMEHDVYDIQYDNNLKYIKQINKNMQGNLCISPKAFVKK